MAVIFTLFVTKVSQFSNQVITQHSVLITRLRANGCNDWWINVIVSCALSNWIYFQDIYHTITFKIFSPINTICWKRGWFRN